MNSQLKVNEPRILDQPDIRIVDGDGHILLIFQGAGEWRRITNLDRKDESDESDDDD
jgi:hypothetical protein